ncbi:MAG: hypothetical protein HYR60_16355 [Acidobacteria bacterium]|nr:hypothetical protein [Acidobacteriota bacterium]MBI3472121.1 hypothetical protein [Candidatus Solibacter usitatus]
MRSWIICFLSAALAAVPALAQERTSKAEKDGIREAIRFERAKQAAADRQEKLEKETASRKQAKKAPERGAQTASARK